eukprot:CAMPEP_0171462914 /NCGR_PEP_ID=MMETSP0945-20130129/6775_1 /TAXON_ID=109269 /ORGANISM="Vaucheria litorea, Strain CCMP2940" /LENGTH=144 /DNA_ID=CAMNT_0011989563 /DNA_START=91 /DNA_END=525 /DNA_ORIENTATION=-
MFKNVLLVVLALSVNISAFISPVSVKATSASKNLMSLNDDITKAEENAIAMTKQFGPRSIEAINAWETYEEIASSDNSAASKPGLDEACDTEKPDECNEFEAQMAELQELIKSGKPVATDLLIEQNKLLMEENQKLKRTIGNYK